MNEIKFRLSLDGAQQVQQGAAGAAQGLNQLGTAANTAQRAAGATGNQVAQLSNQLQDLIVQLEGGVSPITALLQQGSQLSAVFGGFGNTVRGIASLLSPTVVAIAALAGGIGAFGLAVKSGHDDVVELGKAVQLTGNMAGTTQGQFDQLTKSIASGADRSLSALREVGRELVKTGQVGPLAFRATTEAAERYAQVTGKSAADAAQALGRLVADPRRFAEENSRTFNMLTLAQYQYIKSLQERGQTEQAAAVVAEALNQHLRKIDDNLTEAEKLLRSGKNAWDAYWEAAKGAGKPKTVQDELAELERRLKAAREAQAVNGGSDKITIGPAIGAADLNKNTGLPTAAGANSVAAILAQQADAFRRAFREAETATAQALQAAARAAGTDIAGQFDKARTNVEQLSIALEAFKAKAREARLGVTGAAELEKFDKDVERSLANIAATSAAGQQAFSILVTQINSAASVAAIRLQAGQAQLDAQAQLGLVRQREYIEKTAANQVAALDTQIRALERVKAATAALPFDTGDRVASLQAQIDDKRAEKLAAEAGARTRVSVATELQTRSSRELMQALRDEGEQQINQYLEQQARQRAAITNLIQDYKTSVEEAIETQQVELELMYATDTQRDVRLQQLRIEMDLRRRIREINATPYNSQEERQDAIDRATEVATRAKAAAVGKVYADEFKRYTQQISDSLTDALLNAFHSGRDGLKDFGKDVERMFEQMVLKPTIQAYLQPVVGAALSALGVGGANASAGGAGSSWLNMVGTAGQMGGGWGNIANTVGGWVGLGGSSTGAVTGAQIYNSMAAYEGIAASESAAAAAGGTGASAASAAIPIIGWIIAAYMASSAAYKGGATHDMIDGAARYATPGGGIAGTHYMAFRDLGMSEKWATILSGEALVARLLGHKQSVSGFGIGSIVNGDFVQGTSAPFQFGANVLGGGADEGLQDLVSRLAGSVTLSSSLFGGGLKQGLRVGALTDRDRENEVAALLGFFGADNKLIAGTQTGSGAFGAGGPGGAASKIASDQFEGWIKEQMPVLLIQGLQQSDLDKRFGDYFKSVNAGKLDPELAQQMLQTATAVAQLTEAFDPLGGALGQFSDLSVAAFEKLATASGGFDTLGQNLQTYYQAFYSETERTQGALEGIGKTLKAVGIDAVPTTREGFRSLVDGLKDLSSTADQQAFAALMKVAGAFDAVMDASDQAAEAITRERLGLETQLLQLQGNTTELRRRERDQLDASNRSLYDRIVGLQDEKRISDERKGLETQLLQLQGNTTELRRRERAALDESNRALYDQVQALADQKSAVARAQQEAAAVWGQLAQSLVQGVASAYQAVQQQVEAASQQVKTDADERSRKVQTDADTAIRDLESKAKDAERSFKTLLDSVDDNIRKLRGDLAGDGGREQALQELRNARAVLASGGQVDFERLRDAAGTASNIDAAQYGSRLDFQREQARTLQLLREVGAGGRQGLAQVTASIAAQQVAVETGADEQIKAIEKARDQQLAALQNQLHEAQGIAGTVINIDRGVSSVAAAIAALNAAATAAKQNTNTWVPTTGGQDVWASTGGAVATKPTGSQSGDTAMIQGRSGQFSIADAQAWVQDRLAQGDIVGIYARAVAEGIDSRSLDALMGWAPGTSLAEALRRGLPAFATGSAYVPNTGLALVHQGERIIPAAENAVLMRLISEGGGGGTNAAVVAELRAQLAEMRAMHAELMDGVQAIAHSSEKTSRATDDIVSGQVALRTREVTA